MSNKDITEAAKEARRAYKRKWNKEHPDKVKQYQTDYWNRKAAQAEECAEGQDAQEA